MLKALGAVALGASFTCLSVQTMAQIAVSSNDRKMVLDNGMPKVVANPKPDTATMIDLGAKPPKVVAEIDVLGSVVGPPLSVAVSRDGKTIVAQNMVEENAMVFRWDGGKLVDTKQPIKLGGGGAAIRTAGGL